MKKILLTTLTFYLLSCGPGQNEFDAVKKELEACKKTVSDLQNTPEQRLLKVKSELEKNNFEQAKIDASALLKLYPNSKEGIEVKSLLDDIEAKELEKKIAEEKKKTLGYKAISSATLQTVGEGLKLNFTSISIGTRWTFDAYGDEWHFQDAERGNKMITAKVSISSQDKNPSLPPIGVYVMQDGKLQLVDYMQYRLSNWEDYATYLGNYKDRGNDFSYTKSIKFSLGLQIPEEKIGKPIFIVMQKKNCFIREEDRFGNPPVRYSDSGCKMKNILEIDDIGDVYSVVKIFNANKL